MTSAELAQIHGAAFVIPRPWSEVEIAALLESPLVFVLEEPDGFLIGRVVAGEAELLTVAVRPVAQARGTGLRLVRDFLTECAVRGAKSAFLEVAEDNLAARAVYVRAGFVVEGRRRGYYGAVDALMMTHSMVGSTHSTPVS